MLESMDYYESLDHLEKGRQLQQINEEWAELCQRRAALNVEAQVLQDHRSALLRTMGCLALPLPNFESL